LSSLQGNKNGQICAPFALLKDKMLSAPGSFASVPLTRGSAPGLRWGLRPQTPIIGSCSALAMSPHFYDKVYTYVWISFLVNRGLFLSIDTFECCPKTHCFM